MSASNVVTIAPAPPTPLPMPKSFRGKAGSPALRSAWKDLIAGVAPEQLTRDRWFDLEMAARLMVRFRAGELTNASEFKEFKRLMVTLGLSKAEDDEAGRKKGKLAKYVSG